MNEIICPNCNKAFKVDKAGYADILKQVRDHQFEEEIAQRLTLAEQDKKTAVELAEAKIRAVALKKLTEKEQDKIISSESKFRFNKRNSSDKKTGSKTKLKDLYK